MLFCEQDFGDGGGVQPTLGLNKFTGEVWGLDVEQDKTTYFVCSDMDKFIDSFLVFDMFFRLKTLPQDEVEPMLRKIDPIGYDRSEWKMLWDYHGSEEER